jgi:hypothetical protein
MSAAEAFVRVQRLLAARRVVLCFCGADVAGPVWRALESVGLFETEGVETFARLNDAMECELSFLTWLAGLRLIEEFRDGECVSPNVVLVSEG